MSNSEVYHHVSELPVVHVDVMNAAVKDKETKKILVTFIKVIFLCPEDRFRGILKRQSLWTAKVHVWRVTMVIRRKRENQQQP